MSDMVEMELDPEDSGVEGDKTEGQGFEPSDIFGDEAVRTACLGYVCDELIAIRDDRDRADLIDKWNKYRRNRRARPETKERDFPWIKSANVVPPLSQEMVHTVWAKEIGAFTTRNPLVNVRAATGQASDDEEAMTLSRFMNHVASARSGLNWKPNWRRVCYNQVSLGTAFVKVPFLLDQFKFKRKSGTTGTVEEVTQIRHKGPAMVEVRLEDFFMRAYYKDIDRAPLVATRYRFFKHELEQKAASGLYDLEGVTKILGTPLVKYDDSTEASGTNASVQFESLGQGEANNEYEIYEVNVFWDIDGSGVPVDIIMHVEPDSRTILRSEFNPIPMRDIEPIPYMEDPDFIYAMGICELTESPQDEVTSLHNMRLDGIQLAMLKLFKAKSGVGISPDTKVQPMQILFMENPKEDLIAENFPDIAPSCFQAELFAKEYAARTTGVSDNMSGFNDKIVGSGATVGGTMFLTQQGNSILNAILETAVNAATNILIKAFYQCVANALLVDLSWMSPTDQNIMRRILQMNVEDISTKFRFSIAVTDFSKTDEARKQNFLAASTVYAQYGQQAMAFAGALANPQVLQNPLMADFVKSMFIGSTKLIEKLFAFLDIEEVGDYLPFVGDMEFLQEQADKQRQAQLDAQKGATIDAEQGQAALGLGGGAGGLGGASPGMVNPGPGPGPVGPGPGNGAMGPAPGPAGL